MFGEWGQCFPLICAALETCRVSSPNSLALDKPVLGQGGGVPNATGFAMRNAPKWPWATHRTGTIPRPHVSALLGFFLELCGSSPIENVVCSFVQAAGRVYMGKRVGGLGSDLTPTTPLTFWALGGGWGAGVGVLWGGGGGARWGGPGYPNIYTSK